MLSCLFTCCNAERNNYYNFEDDYSLPTASNTSVIKFLTILQGSYHDHFLSQKETKDSHRLLEAKITWRQGWD